jgi:hypothetical protein
MLGDDASVVDGVTDTGRGRWRHVKGPRPWSETTMWRLRGGLDSGVEAPGRTL